MMKTKKAGPRIIFALFIVVICGSWIIWSLFRGFTDTENSKKQKLSPMPQITSVSDYERFPRKFEEYIDDRLPFRSGLIALSRSIDYLAFGNVEHDRVAVGKDDWLFYVYTEDGNPLANYQGTDLLTEEELAAVAENCLRQRDYLAARGTEFVIFIAPNKERIDWEKMPDHYGPPAEDYRVLQVVNYLRENTDLRVVYPYEELMAAKEAVPEELYYKTDTHWNFIGGYVGSCALLRELGIEMPSLTSGRIKISCTGEYGGDLAKSLGLETLLKSRDRRYTVEGYDTHRAERLQATNDGVYQYRAEGADPRKVYVYRDSFFEGMLPFISTQFNESFLRFHSYYKSSDLEDQQPDIFVYETVERYLKNLFDFSVQ